MKRFIVLVPLFLFAEMELSAEPLFSSRSESEFQLNEQERRIYAAVKNNINTRDLKIVYLAPKALSKTSVDVPLFEREGYFNLLKDGSERELRWRGSSGKQDRFVIQRINGKYAGFFLMDGRHYILTPLSGNKVVLSLASVEASCAVKERTQK